MLRPLSTRGAAAIVENLLKHKWSRTILRHLRDGVNDPVEIARLELDIASSAMSERLRTMVRHQLIERVTRYPRARVVLYRLTPKGRRILTVLELISQLDRYPDHDPRALEEIFVLDLRPREPAPLLLAEVAPAPSPVPRAPARKSLEKSVVSSP